LLSGQGFGNGKSLTTNGGGKMGKNKEKKNNNSGGSGTRKKINRREFLKAGALISTGAGLTILSPKWTFGAKDKGPIKVGLLPPITGLCSVYGDDCVHAGELTVQMINDEGGVLGRELQLVIQDDGTIPETAVPAAERLIKKFGCKMICGDMWSNSRLAVSTQVSEPYKTVMNNFSYDEGAICGRYYFQMNGVPNQQIDPMVDYLVKKYGKRWYFIGGNYEWPRGSIAAAKEELLKNGGEVVGEEYNPVGTTDFSSILMRIKEAKPDVLESHEAGSDQFGFLKQFAAQGLLGKIPICSTYYDEVFARDLEPQVREGFYACNTYFMAVPTKENEAFLAKLRQKYGENVTLTSFSASIISCFRIWAKAVEKAGTTDSDAVVKAQEGGPGEKYGISTLGPQGKVTVVKENHYTVQPAHLIQVQKDGSEKIIQSWADVQPVIPDRYGGCVASVQYGCRPLKQKCPPFPTK
jgi:ABC-type branched-subunit amino acid transport system substrate-binding protein